MGHIPQSGNHGLINALKAFNDRRKILIHINNTNPILNENSPERKILIKENIEVAYDGMEIYL
jgi:pyrroloquinoline quinone biosynthesis protein B